MSTVVELAAGLSSSENAQRGEQGSSVEDKLESKTWSNGQESSRSRSMNEPVGGLVSSLSSSGSAIFDPMISINLSLYICR